MKRGTIYRVVCALIALLVLSAALPALAASTQMKATGTVNVRNGPGLNYTLVGQLKQGQIVTTLSTTGGWTQIEFQNSNAYVSSIYLMSVSGSSSGSTSADGQAQATANVNVRSGPGTSYDKLGQLKKGDVVPYSGMTNGWAKIEYQDGEAYVSATYIKVLSSGSGTSTGTGTQMQATANVNVRSGPSTKYSKLGALTTGQIITKQGVSNGWVQFTYNGKTAYVSGAYLKDVTSSTPTTPTTPTTEEKIYAIRSTTIYSGPGTSYSRIGYLDPGDSVAYLGDYGSWYKVQLGANVGYVPVADTQKDNANNPTMTTVNKYWTARYSTYYYSTATLSSSYRLGTVSAGESVYVQAASSEWAKCSIGGRVVYIKVADLNGGSTSGSTTVNEYRTVLYDNTGYYSTTTASNSYIIGTLNRNESVYVNAVDSTWAQCSVNGRTAYILLTNLSAGSTSGTQTTVNAYRNTLYANVEYYASANSGSPTGVISTRNTQVYVYWTSSSWAYCRYGSSSVYIRVSDLTSGTGNNMTDVNDYRYTQYTNVSYYSSTSGGTALGTISAKNTKVYVQAANSTWAYCYYNGQYVYIYLSELTTGDSGNMATVNEIRTANANNVAYYNSASTASQGLMGVLNMNDQVYVEAVNATWARCRIDNQTRYIEVKYLSGGSAGGYGMTSVNRYAYARYSGVSCYYSPSTSQSRAGSLSANEQVFVLAANATWAQCQVPGANNAIYYIQLSEISY